MEKIRKLASGSYLIHFRFRPLQHNYLKHEVTEETDREAQAHAAIVFLAPLEKYFAALGLDSLAPLSKLNCKLSICKKKPGALCICGLVVECWPGNLRRVSSNLEGNIFFPINFEYPLKNNQLPCFFES